MPQNHATITKELDCAKSVWTSPVGICTVCLVIVMDTTEEWVW